MDVRALVWHGPRQLSVDELPDPVAAPGEVLLAGSDAIAGIEQRSERRELIGVHRPGGGRGRADVAEICAFLAALPPSVAVPGLTVLHAALQALGHLARRYGALTER